MLRIFSVTTLAVLALLPCQTSAAVQSSAPRTVLDYYLLLPEKYFEANKEQRSKWMLDPKRGAIVDVRNGYLYAPGDGAQMTLYVCLFRKTDHSYVVAVKSDFEGSTYLDFLAYKNGTFNDIGKSILPTRIDESLEYEMPRYGRTIKVRNKQGKRLYSLAWDGSRFKRQPS